MSTPAELKEFEEKTNAIFEKAHQLALLQDANTVTVQPGGAVFTTITDAINSIHDASPQLEYQVIVGPGTYTEQVTTKSYIYIVGAGTTSILILKNTSGDTTAVNVTGAGGISQITIECLGGAKANDCRGILMSTSDRYHIRMVKIFASDEGNPNIDARGITNHSGSTTGYVIINNCTIVAAGTGSQSFPIAVEGYIGGFSYFMEACSIYVQGKGCAIQTAMGADLTISDSNIEGTLFALNNSDELSPITAHSCQIKGPISKGVVVD